ncbi:MAG: hypothetical protein ACR2N4_00605 [Jatrophihabitans sp.]
MALTGVGLIGGWRRRRRR